MVIGTVSSDEVISAIRLERHGNTQKGVRERERGTSTEFRDQKRQDIKEMTEEREKIGSDVEEYKSNALPNRPVWREDGKITIKHPKQQEMT